MNEFKENLMFLIEEACRQLADIADDKGSDNKCHIHIPLKDGKPRISEQELKYVFLELFIKCETMQGYTFSVETPTEGKYKFTENGENVNLEYGKGRKANIDVVIFKGDNRVAMIEFKSGNPDKHSHAKDFIKLKQEPGNNLIRIFVELYSATDARTLLSIHDKLYNNEYGNIDGNTEYVGFSLNHEKRGCSFIVDTGEKIEIKSSIDHIS